MPTTRRAATVLALTGLALASCGSKGSSTVSPLGESGSTTSALALDEPTTTSATTAAADRTAAAAATTTSIAATAATAPVAGVTPRSIVFRQFTISVQQVVTSMVEPGSFDDPKQQPSIGDTRYAYVQVKVKNNLSFGSSFIYRDEVRLAPAAGEPITMEDGTGTSTDVVEYAATNAGWFAFPLEGSVDLTTAVLVFGRAGEQQERLPLTGTAPATAWPKTITIAPPGQLKIPHGSGNFTIKVTIDKAQLTNAIAYDRERRAYVSEQALAGRRKLYLEFTADVVEYESPGNAGEVLAPDVARLVVDGERQSKPAEISDSAILTKGTPYHGIYVIDVPTRGRVQLEWGPVDNAVRVDVPVR